MSSFFNPTPLVVTAGDTAKAADLNSYGTSLDAAFDLVEAEFAGFTTDAEGWAGVAQEWAEKAEDAEVTVGHYSSLHWAAKSEDFRDSALTYATNSASSATDSDTAKVAAETAQTAAELAEANAETAQTAAELAETHAETAETNAELAETNAETAETGALAAQAAAEIAETNAETAETNAELAETNSQLRVWEAEAARQTSDNYAVTVEDTYVDIVTSDGDGTYTDTPSTDYSALHWAAKSTANDDAVDIAFDDTSVSFTATEVQTALEELDSAVTSSGFYDAYVKVSDVKASGTAGGTFTSGSWQTRDINTEDNDGEAIASISSNQVTLPAATYECEIRCPARRCEQNQARLYDTTGAVVLVLGCSSESAYVDDVQYSFISGEFTLSASSVLEIQHRCKSTRAGDGFGEAASWGDEVYTTAIFRRRA